MKNIDNVVEGKRKEEKVYLTEKQEKEIYKLRLKDFIPFSGGSIKHADRCAEVIEDVQDGMLFMLKSYNALQPLATYEALLNTATLCLGLYGGLYGGIYGINELIKYLE